MNDAPRHRIGLIGYPISHSRSPELFYRYFADRPDILARYSYELVEKKTFEEAYDTFLKDYVAVNVTAPFKTDAFRAADVRERSALLCQASNLLVKKPEVTAYNTDFEAVCDILRDTLGPVSGKTTLVIGCGGAGKAAAAAAATAGMQVIICNRTTDKAAAFAEHLSDIGTVTATSLDSLKDSAERADAVISTLSGPVDIVLKTLSENPGLFAGKTVLEASYQNPFLQNIPCRKYIPGLEWLRLQAIATYRLILGQTVVRASDS